MMRNTKLFYNAYNMYYRNLSINSKNVILKNIRNISSKGSYVSIRHNSTTATCDNESVWRHFTAKRFIAVTLTSASIGVFGYYFYKADYNLGKTEWMMEQDITLAIHGKPLRQQNIINSEFKIGLSDELSDELSLYFLQLDSDKENGVKRSDGLYLASEHLGFKVPPKLYTPSTTDESTSSTTDESTSSTTDESTPSTTDESTPSTTDESSKTVSSDTKTQTPAEVACHLFVNKGSGRTIDQKIMSLVN
eukprot:GHVR01013825.1.p1 GENE.GHVR01013825.1~~GHVR01013825.1.p1  ORF type:complete len:249 (+),score=49.74 GHVR01013825.1:43-789(+)